MSLKKKNLLRAIKDINKNFGWFGKEALDEAASHFGMTAAEVYSAASFYDEINLEEPPQLTVQICNSANCQSKGVDSMISELEAFFNGRAGHGGKLKFEKISCLGRCLEGPVMRVNGTFYTKMNKAKAMEVIGQWMSF